MTQTTPQEFIANRSDHISLMTNQNDELSAISNQREHVSLMASHSEVSLMSNHSNDSSNGPSVTTMETDDGTVATTTEPSNGTDSPVGHDEQNLSLSVEIAAVNQAILALTGQQPIGVKLENGGDSNLPSS